MSVLAAVTGDSQWSDLALNITTAAVKSSVWQGSDGIITEGSNTTENSDEVDFKGAPDVAIFTYITNPCTSRFCSWYPRSV